MAYMSSLLNFVAGVAGGWAFYVVWRHVLPQPRSRAFWQALPVHTAGLLRSADPDDTLRHYGALMKHTATFAGRNTLAVVAGIVPVAALFALAALLDSPDRRGPVAQLVAAFSLAEFDAGHAAFLAGAVAGSLAAAWRSARAGTVPA